MALTKESVLEALRNVDDPDLGKDLVTLGMVKDVAVSGRNVAFTVVLTTPACPMKDMIRRACENAIVHYADPDAIVSVNMTSNVTSSRSAKQTVLPGVRNIIAVGSAKGGVGKSTVAASLAVGLARQGAAVGLIDADIYGPSMPLLFGVAGERPGVKKVDGGSRMVPVESHGVKLLSIGFFAEASQAVAWRGPMATKALAQMIGDTEWGELDYLLLDMPPGTGDIHLTLVQTVPVTGAVVVTTPQGLAVADARKGIAMFRMPQINVPVLGIVENMSWFTPAELPENKYYIFGKGGADELAEEFGIPVLGRIPLVQSIGESGEAGRPAVLQEDTPAAQAFAELSKRVAQEIAIRNATHGPTRKVEIVR